MTTFIGILEPLSEDDGCLEIDEYLLIPAERCLDHPIYDDTYCAFCRIVISDKGQYEAISFL